MHLCPERGRQVVNTEKKSWGGNKKHTVHHNCDGVMENLPGKNLTVEPEQSRNNGGVMRSGHSVK